VKEYVVKSRNGLPCSPQPAISSIELYPSQQRWLQRGRQAEGAMGWTKVFVFCQDPASLGSRPGTNCGSQPSSLLHSFIILQFSTSPLLHFSSKHSTRTPSIAHAHHSFNMPATWRPCRFHGPNSRHTDAQCNRAA
jgi:hypothetical protein